MSTVSAFFPGSSRRLAAAVLFAALVLGGCAVPGGKPGAEAPARPAVQASLPSGGPALARGMASYEDGNYGEAASQLRLSLEQKLSAPEQILARKHLAFSYCVTGKDRHCGEEFRKLIDLSPSFELDPAEAGHPIWGPVFRRVKAKKAELRK
jgi:Tfp pilus assembly protein PilF